MAMAALGRVPRHAYEDASFRGALDRLESLGRLRSAEPWEEPRAMINQLVHEHHKAAPQKAATLTLVRTMAIAE